MVTRNNVNSLFRLQLAGTLENTVKTRLREHFSTFSCKLHWLCASVPLIPLLILRFSIQSVQSTRHLREFNVGITSKYSLMWRLLDPTGGDFHYLFVFVVLSWFIQWRSICLCSWLFCFVFCFQLRIKLSLLSVALKLFVCLEDSAAGAQKLSLSHERKSSHKLHPGLSRHFSPVQSKILRQKDSLF